MRNKYDVIVIGGGHAGIEAALAADRQNCSVAMITAKIKRIGEMSCNPAIGGIAKGTIVREIDALDGSMGRTADATRLQFRMLNRKKGPAVWGPRVQSDARAYAEEQQRYLDGSSVKVIEDEVIALEGRTQKIDGVRCRKYGIIEGATVVLAAGTFLRGRLFRGGEYWKGGRIDDITADRLEEDLVRRMFHVERFKTGTPPRILRNTVNTDVLEIQASEKTEFTFSFSNYGVSKKEEECYVTFTDVNTMAAAKKYLHLSPLMAGKIEGTGPRYCPSYEDKIVKFPERKRHKIYVESMGYQSRFLYLNGLSTSLPREAQNEMVRSLPGFREAVIADFGYAVEYTYFHHSEIEDTLRLRRSENIFVAGQICGTSGYEEAAALGLIAGVNAGRKAREIELARLSRMQSYIAVMIDDITRRGASEPYRMFSSRAENRLHLRQDNADRRMYAEGKSLGLLSKEKQSLLQWNMIEAKRIKQLLENEIVDGVRMSKWIRRTENTAQKAIEEVPALSSMNRKILRSVLLDEKYIGYIERNLRKHESTKRSEKIRLDDISSYMEIDEICWEAREALEKAKPKTLADAERIQGIRPTDLQGLLIHLGRKRSTWNMSEEGGS